MPKRVHELAKELGVPSKELMERAAELGINVSSHMATVSDADAARLADALGGGAATVGGDEPPGAGSSGGAGSAGEPAAPRPGKAEEVGHISWFDKTTGQGEIVVGTRTGATKGMPFDLRRTRLEDTRFVPMEQGLEVAVTYDDEEIKSIRSRANKASN